MRKQRMGLALIFFILAGLHTFVAVHRHEYEQLGFAVTAFGFGIMNTVGWPQREH